MITSRLSAQDASFVFGEDARIPLHVGCLGTMEAAPVRNQDGSIDIERLRAGIAERLHQVPQFRKRLAEIPFDQGRPVWIDDGGFRIENHVHLTALPQPGQYRQLLDLMGRIQSGMLDRSRPLWEIYFVDGLDGGRNLGIIAKIHHAIIDGTAGVALGLLLFDMTPEPRRFEPAPWEPGEKPGTLELLLDAWSRTTTDAVDFVKATLAAVRNPSKPIEHVRKFSRALETLTSDYDPLPFNRQVSSRRAFETVSLPLEDVMAARRVDVSATLNDVALAAVAGGLRRYLNDRGMDPDEFQRVKTLVPVDNRANGDTSPGCNVSVFVLELPVDEPDPVERIRFVAERSRLAKELDLADGANMWARVTSALPTPVLRLASWFQFRGLMNNANLMVSNVRGPATPFYSFGAKVHGFFPYFGVQDGLGLNLVLFSYDGKLLIGITADPQLVPDLGVLAQELQKSFAELTTIV